MRGIFLTVLVLAPVLAPGSGAAIELRLRDYGVEDLRNVSFWVNVTESAPEASAARAEADTNHDGTVSDAERVDYEDRLRNSINEALDDPLLVLDDGAPHGQRAVSVTTRGLPGPVSSPASFEIDVRYALEFGPPADRVEHWLERATTREDAGPVRVTAPVGYKLTRGSGISNFMVSNEDRTVSGQNDGLTPVEVGFAPYNSTLSPWASAGSDDGGGRDAEGVPGTALFAGAAAAAIAAGWRKRARP